MHDFIIFGECLVELSYGDNGLLQQGFAGDVYSVSVYLKRANPETRVRLLCALGHDPFSQALRAELADEGVDTSLLLHHPEHADYLFNAPRSRLRVDLTALHIDAIAYGQGIGLLPHWVVEKRERHHPEDLVNCLPGWEPVPLPITLLYAYGHQSRRTHALLEFLRSQVPAQWHTTTATA